MKKEIYISKICGLCYGSNNAIESTRKVLKEKKNIVIYKEILHNKNVMNELKNNGASLKNNLSEITSDNFVIVRAHGEPSSTFKYFHDNSINYLDCTCPNVKAIHLLVNEKDREGYKIIIIGKHGLDGKPIHPEVEGTAGWCNNPLLIEDENELEKLNLSYDKYYLVTQTTFNKDKAEILIEKIHELMKNNDKVFEYKNTICNAQKNINIESVKLANKVDVMIIIGGKNSSNSKELFNNVSKVKKAFFIENPDEILDLIKNNKLDVAKIGITAGASTMKEDIIRVKQLLELNL